MPYLILLLLLFTVGFYLFKKRSTPTLPKTFKVNIPQLLTSQFHYFTLLSKSEQAHFVRRVKRFVVNKQFETRENLTLTDEMKVLIASSAIQLTFGLPSVFLKNFYKIIIYPSKYYSSATRTTNIGEVNKKGVIVLSWEHFKKGNARPHDGLNVGLHEMSHALELENTIKNGEFNFLSKNYLQRLQQEIPKETRRIHQGKNTFLRSYATTNNEEFFAVSIEYFFEKPVQFQKEVPELYKILTHILRQNPAKRVSK